MDFDRAAARLAADQTKLRSQRRSRGGGGGPTGRGGVGLAVSARARREAEERREKAARRLVERKKVRARTGYGVRYMERCDARLGVVCPAPARAAAAASPSQSPSPAPGAPSRPGGAAPLPTWSATPSLLLRPDSIYGDGDKLSLPPSVLAHLAEVGAVGGGVEDGGQGQQQRQQQPLAFRVGVLNPEYAFPSSPALRELMEHAPVDDEGGADDSDSDSDDGSSDDDGGDESMDDGGGRQQSLRRKRRPNPQDTGPYLEELSHKYLTYTHATVVEFTMDEGRVGLPRSVASALLMGDGAPPLGGGGVDDGRRASAVPRTRTVDPASVGSGDGGRAGGAAVDSDGAPTIGDAGSKPALPPSAMDDDDRDKTPGHVAWGLFDVPDAPVEITLVRLPKGRACTLVPTPQAVRDGFYTLKDVKLVLEQSLIRTRATLSRNDTVNAWHRGTRFDLTVRSVSPDEFGAVSCIDTDIEVDLAPPESDGDGAGNAGGGIAGDAATAAGGGEGGGSFGVGDGVPSPSFAPGVGRRLSSGSGPAARRPDDSGPPTTVPVPPTAAPPSEGEKPTASLPPEPPTGQTDDVCTVQVRGDAATGRRRFDIARTTVRDLFAFASSVCGMDDVEGRTFRLVTRFPRRVLAIGGDVGGSSSSRFDGGESLADAGIGQGQEMFMVERM